MIAAINLLGACTPHALKSQELIVLSYSHYEAVTHFSSLADIAWIESVEKDSRGCLKITPYWDAALISKDGSCEELIQGVVDIAYIEPSFARSGYEIDKGISGFYYDILSYDARREIFEAVWDKFPAYADEFKDMQILASSTSPAYQLISNKPVRTVADFRGLRVNDSNPYAALMEELGAEVIELPVEEIHSALKKGTLDACLVSCTTIKAYRLYESAKYITVLNLSGSCHPSRAMNLDSWNLLPSEIQDIFNYSRKFWEQEDDKSRDADEVEGFESAKKAGVTILRFSGSELSRFYEVTTRVMLDKARRLDGRGLPGSEIFHEIRSMADQD